MSEVRKYRVINRLTQLALNGTGMRVEDALNRADAGLRTLQPGFEKTLEQVIGQMAADFGPAAGMRRDEADFTDLYGLALRVIDASLGAPTSGVDQAAHSLCDLVDRCSQEARWDWPAIEVHIASLNLLLVSRTLSPDGREAVLTGLQKVSRGKDAA